MMKALLVAGGSLWDNFTLSQIEAENYDIMMAVDAGLHFFERNKREPDYIIGDFDSVSTAVLEQFPKSHQIRLNSEKDDTDTEHALQLALNLKCNNIHIHGATGTRFDHVLGNLQLLGFALRKKVNCKLIDPYNQISLIDQDTYLKKDEQFGEYVSLLPFTPEVTGLTLRGFKYPLTDYTMQSFYIEGASNISGISNEIIAAKASICLTTGILVLVESSDKKATVRNDLREEKK
jgi:thiamine pyrophosphokinase